MFDLTDRERHTGRIRRLLARTAEPVDVYRWLLALADNLLLPDDPSLIPDGAFS